jgi:replication-associated recombination protein RarA
VGSILRLSDDIGIMANRILEQADQILKMADNIGLQADQIILTQQQQNLNVAATQAALLNAQQLMIGLIVSYGL